MGRDGKLSMGIGTTYATLSLKSGASHRLPVTDFISRPSDPMRASLRAACYGIRSRREPGRPIQCVLHTMTAKVAALMPA